MLRSSFPIVSLGGLTSVEPAYGSSQRAVPRTSATQPRYIRITDFGDDGIEPGHEYVTLGAPERKHELELNDVLFARTGSVGKTYLHEDASEPAVFAGYCIRFRFDLAKVLPEFVYWWTKTDAYARWVNAIQRPSVQANINKEEFKRCPIPLPSLDEQSRIVSAIADARGKRKAKLAEADALLAGLDVSVLDALGIAPKPPQQRIFARPIGSLLSSRFDPDYHSLRFRMIRESIENGRYPATPLAEICDQITTGFAAGPQNQADGYNDGVPHLRPLNLDLHGQLSLGGTKFVPAAAVSSGDWCVQGEVLFNNTNSTSLVGKSAVFDLEQPCACSNHVTRLTPRPGINAEYLACLFNALRSTGYLGLLSTNFNNQAGINTATLARLAVPNPPQDEQERIASEAQRRRAEARRLRGEAEAGWAAARAGFEVAVVG